MERSLAVAGLGVVTAVGAILAHRVEHMNRFGIAGLISIGGLLLISAATLQSIVGLVPFALYYFAVMTASVVADARVQHAIANDDARATITPVGAFAIEIVSLVVFVAFGFLAHDSLFRAFQVFGAFLVLAGAAFALSRSRVAA